VLQALGALAAIIAVHEWGHFSAARLQNIHVTQFAIGFGPPLISFKRGEVEYSLRAIPLGGYVAFPDDDPKNSSFQPDDPDLLQNRSIPERALVISAGVIANVIFALAVLFAQVNLVGKAQTSYLPGVLVPEVNPGGVAEQAGFHTGDVILRVGDHEIKANPDQVPDLVSTIKAHPNEQLNFQVQRGEQVLDLQATPAVGKDGKGAIGVSLFSHTYIKHTKPSSVIDAFRMTGAEFNRLGGSVLKGLKQIVTNFNSMAGQLSGPVAIVAAGSEIARTDVAGLYQFCAIVNINLAVVNILPLPALDGGYLLLLLLEAARGKKLPESLEQGVMTSGLLLMMVLGVGLAVRDTINLALR
jgi:membrane-associated protease RseP (regulator of RpoE activity)